MRQIKIRMRLFLPIPSFIYVFISLGTPTREELSFFDANLALFVETEFKVSVIFASSGPVWDPYLKLFCIKSLS